MSDFGGVMTFTYAGNQLKLRAKFDSEPTKAEYDVVVNQDLSISRMIKNSAYVAEASFEDLPANSAITWDSIFAGGPYNIVLSETETKRLHTWTGSFFIGKPRKDHHTGEVTGIKLVAPKYQMTQGSGGA